MIHNIVIGDSYWFEVTGDIDRIDPDPNWPNGANWTGNWRIAADINPASPSLASGNMVAAPTYGVWKGKITPAQSAVIAAGSNYYLIVQMKNPAVDYNKEIAQDKVVVKPQGTTP